VAHIGPRPAGALPLEQLDGTDGQPLARMALAWLPVGVAAGALLGAFTRSARAVVLGALTVIAAAMLLLSAAASDAIANNEPFRQDLATPLGAAGVWVSLVLLVIGAAIGERVAAASPRAPSAA
jgi:hypothetical protein